MMAPERDIAIGQRYRLKVATSGWPAGAIGEVCGYVKSLDIFTDIELRMEGTTVPYYLHVTGFELETHFERIEDHPDAGWRTIDL